MRCLLVTEVEGHGETNSAFRVEIGTASTQAASRLTTRADHDTPPKYSDLFPEPEAVAVSDNSNIGTETSTVQAVAIAATDTRPTQEPETGETAEQRRPAESDSSSDQPQT